MRKRTRVLKACVLGFLILWTCAQVYIFSPNLSEFHGLQEMEIVPTQYPLNKTVPVNRFRLNGRPVIPANSGFLTCIKNTSTSNYYKQGCTKDNANLDSPFKRRLKLLYNNLDTNAAFQIRRCEDRYLKQIEYVLHGESICNIHHIDVVILINSSPSNFRQRQAIRNTWGKLNDNFRIAFLLGNSQGQITRDAIKTENAAFGDIVQGNFDDTYRNLSLKTVMGLSWVSQNCKQAKFVMKTDDDTFVNTPNVLALLGTNGSKLNNGVGGRCYYCSKPDRNMSSKWYISYKLYPGAYYPGFCSGVGYVTSMRIVELLSACFERLPMFPLEDIYVSFCIFELKLNLFNLAGFYTVKPPSLPCLFKQDTLILAHGLTPGLLEAIWTTPCDPGTNVDKNLVHDWQAGLIV